MIGVSAPGRAVDYDAASVAGLIIGDGNSNVSAHAKQELANPKVPVLHVHIHTVNMETKTGPPQGPARPAGKKISMNNNNNNNNNNNK